MPRRTMQGRAANGVLRLNQYPFREEHSSHFSMPISSGEVQFRLKIIISAI